MPISWLAALPSILCGCHGTCPAIMKHLVQQLPLFRGTECDSPRCLELAVFHNLTIALPQSKIAHFIWLVPEWECHEGKLNEIWIYLKLIENENWHVVPSWWSIIAPKNNQSNIFEWYPLVEIEKNIVVISGSKWNGAVSGRNQSRLFPTCHWWFPTCNLSSWVSQMPLTAPFHLLPSTSHRGLPQLEPNGKPPMTSIRPFTEAMAAPRESENILICLCLPVHRSFRSGAPINLVAWVWCSTSATGFAYRA